MDTYFTDSPYLDARVAQSFSQSSRHQHEAGALQLGQAQGLVLFPTFEVVVAGNQALWFSDLIVGVGVDAFG